MQIEVAYDERLLDWRLGKDHPTNPERARNALRILESMGADLDVQRIERNVTVDELARVHSHRYIAETMGEGINDEWQGRRLDLARTALLMYAGTAQLTDHFIGSSQPRVAFAPQGAKHHAQYERGSGFCVFNDFAGAALRLAQAGEKVLYLDTDAHHGDGVEMLTYGNTRIMTASVHDGTIFPGTGKCDHPEVEVFNWALPRASGDSALIQSVCEALELATDFEPTIILFAIGGDGYIEDPLSSLEYTYEGYARLGNLVGKFAADHGGRILMGGAGGYLPHTHTPGVWATTVSRVADSLEQNLPETVYTTSE